MQKLFTTALLVAALSTGLSAQQSGLELHADSVYVEAPALQFEINLYNYIINHTGSTVTLEWVRTLEQPFPSEWVTNFCDRYACYLGQTSTAQFELEDGDTSLLKPVIYPNETPGMGVYRVRLESLTPGVEFLAHIVYVAVATDESSGTVEIESVRDLTLFPNPAGEVLHAVFVDPDFHGTLTVSDATGRPVLTQANATAHTQLDIAMLPAGLYLLQAHTDAGKLLITKGFSKK